MTKALYDIPAPLSRTSASTNLSAQSESTLSAPGLVDDFYARPICWSKTNLLAVATRCSVNFRNMETSEIGNVTNGMHLETPTCIEWNPDGSNSKQLLAIGFTTGDVRIIDVLREKQSRSWVAQLSSWNLQDDYVGGISWRDSNVLSVGYESGGLRTFDIREQNRQGRTPLAHKARLTGISWNPDGRFLATGSGDGIVACWDPRQTNRAIMVLDPLNPLGQPEEPSSSNPLSAARSSNEVSRRWRMRKHTTTVKALAWCPWAPEMLATGGGTKDGTIRFWHGTTGAVENRSPVLRSYAQVSSLNFSTACREIVATLGYAFAVVVPEAGGDATLRPAPRRHSILVHNYPKGELTGRIFDPIHGRISDGRLSPEGTHLVTCGADETIRVYKIFGKQEKSLEKIDDGMWSRSVVR